MRDCRQRLGLELENATASIHSLETVSSLRHQLEAEQLSFSERQGELDMKANTIGIKYQTLLGREFRLDNLMIADLTNEIDTAQAELHK